MEKLRLIDVVYSHKNVIENKRTDAVTTREKEAWMQITNEYNSCVTVKRDCEQLKMCYENLKKKTKKDAAHDRAEARKTGGGIFT